MTAPTATSTLPIVTPGVVRLSGTMRGLVLSCEHAGRKVPDGWNNLGLGADFFATHFAQDIGSGQLTRSVAALLEVPAICGEYSRLFYDINRQPRSWDCIRPDMGGIPIPGNRDVPDADRVFRDLIVRQPFDDALIDTIADGDVLLGIHSFSAVYDGDLRPTEIGVLRRDGCSVGESLLSALRTQDRFVIGDNAPYDLRKVPPGLIDRIQERVRIPAVILEVRNDLLGDKQAIDAVARLLAEAIRSVVPLRRVRGSA